MRAADPLRVVLLRAPLVGGPRRRESLAAPRALDPPRYRPRHRDGSTIDNNNNNNNDDDDDDDDEDDGIRSDDVESDDARAIDAVRCGAAGGGAATDSHAPRAQRHSRGADFRKWREQRRGRYKCGEWRE